ncbi:hypothetical protein EDD76_11220 [Kineothrix alysoides]|uniref:Sugar phosphate isomerase/epimerase n=1 Tax=Kineothrix alysoides TaxID=1469948 RepID=A0A4R1QSZ9_9FIRM|nr:DUF692 family multinuclear iron-containing protein [Kineothrix alysoides]TCL56193.1 hypothetical protein EDD76_11220 [Kineothrix alysoides]
MSKKYKLGCNWSLALRNLIKSNSIDIDYIKAGEQKDFKERMHEIRDLRPILLHGGIGFSLRTGMISLSQVDFTYLNKLIMQCGSPQYGIHIALTQDESRDMFTDEKIFANMTSVINEFKKALSVPLLIENTPDCLVDQRFYKFVPYIFPDQINRLLHDNDVSLLLDITHAKITARFHGWDIHGYLESLLLNRVKEIHINGCGADKKGVLMDSHQAMEDEDFALLDWVLCRTNPEIISLEYNGYGNENESTIASQIKKFFDFF